MPYSCVCEEKNAGAAASFTLDGARNHYAPHIVIEPVHLDISLTFDDLSTNSVRGRVVITLRNHHPMTIKSLKDRSNLTLNAMSFDDLVVTGESLSHTYDGKEIKLHWESPFQPEEERKVTIDYTVNHPIAGLYFGEEDTKQQNIAPSALFVVTDLETEKARYWLPCVDFPIVRTTLKFHISAPERFTSLANGRLDKEEITDGVKTTHWSLDFPCPSYLICIAVGDFIEYDDGDVDGVPVKYYTIKGYSQDVLKITFGDITKRMMRWLQDKLDMPMPWPKYYQIAAPSCGGAMENISLVTWTDKLLLDEEYAKEIRHSVNSTNVHEMAHTYFGDLTVIRHFEHAWLKEGWATYISSCWLEDNESKEDWEYDMLSRATRYFEECGRYQRPIVTRRYDSSWSMFDSHLYPGSAWRIHMLRMVLGDDVFWTGVRRFLKVYAQRVVETSDFQAVFERSSGLNLSRFFDQWFYSKGYPQLKGSYQYSADNKWVKITLEQAQVNEKENVPFFEFSLDIRITDRDGAVFNHTIVFENEEKRAIAIIPLNNAKPSILQIDPDTKTLFTIDLSDVDKDVLEATAESASNIQSRIWAYTELIRIGTWSSLNTVKRLILKEPFFRVRAKVAEKLGSVRTAFSLPVLAQLLENETDPKCMHFVVSACHVRDDQIREAVLKFLKRDYLPYKAHAEALVALGIQKNPEDLKYLLDAAKDDTKIGFHAIVRSGALRALGYTHTEEAFDYLITRCGKGIEYDNSRRPAISALRMAAEWLPKEKKNLAIDTLASFLRDPNNYNFVVMTTIASLVQLGASSQYRAIENVSSSFPEQDRPWLVRQLKILRDKDSSEKSSTALKEQIDKLEERIRKLEKKLAEKEAEEQARK